MQRINLIAQSVIPIPGLRPELHDSHDTLIRESNLDEKTSELQAALDARPWFKDLLRDATKYRSRNLSALMQTDGRVEDHGYDDLRVV